MNLIYGFFLIVKVSALWVKPIGIGTEAITPVAQSLPFSKQNSGSVEVSAKIIMAIQSPGQNCASLPSLNCFFLPKVFPHTGFSLVEKDLCAPCTCTFSITFELLRLKSVIRSQKVGNSVL